MLTVYTITTGPVDTHAYIIINQEDRSALLIDAPHQSMERIMRLLAEQACQLKAIVLTHGHWDHIADATALKNACHVPIYAHRLDEPLYNMPGLMAALMPKNLSILPVRVDHWVKHGDSIHLGTHAFEVRHVPGHCPGNIMLYTSTLGAFVGDALFKDSIGRTDLPGACFKTLQTSIREQIYTLPEDTKVFPGHGPSTRVGDERCHNPYVCEED